MNDRPPRVSIGLPVSNGEAYLRAALDGLLGQTYEDFELILSDNASTDATPEICQEAAARDPRVRLFLHDRNRGANWNYVFVFEQARGELFKWAASDDLCEPTFLARAVEAIDADPQVVLCTPRTRLIDGRGDPLPDDTSLPDDYCRSPKAYRRFGNVLLSHWCHEFYGLIRTEAVRPAVRRTHFTTDKVILAELALRGTFHVLPEVLLSIRRHQGQISQAATATERYEREAPEWRGWTVLAPRFIAAWDCLWMIPRTGQGPLGQIASLAMLARYLSQPRKWRRAIGELLGSWGIGARRPRLLPRGAAAEEVPT